MIKASKFIWLTGYLIKEPVIVNIDNIVGIYTLAEATGEGYFTRVECMGKYYYDVTDKTSEILEILQKKRVVV